MVSSLAVPGRKDVCRLGQWGGLWEEARRVQPKTFLLLVLEASFRHVLAPPWKQCRSLGFGAMARSLTAGSP